MPITAHSNLSLYAVPAAYSLAFLPHVVKLFYLAANGLTFDNLRPRKAIVSPEDADLQKAEIAKKVERLSATHTNGLEIFPLFASAVIIGNFARLPAKTLNIVSGLFLSSRIAYAAVYFFQKTEAQSWVRTAAFFTGQFASLFVLVSSATKVFKLTAF